MPIVNNVVNNIFAKKKLLSLHRGGIEIWRILHNDLSNSICISQCYNLSQQKHKFDITRTERSLIWQSNDTLIYHLLAYFLLSNH